jgi:hypothetical protein
MLRLLLLVGLFCLSQLGGCSSAQVASVPATQIADEAPIWSELRLPGKRSTRYVATLHEGRPAWLAQADGSASMWRRRLHVAPQDLGRIEFSWWVDGLVLGADLSQGGLDDAPARLVFAFEGDRSRWSMRNRMISDMAETLGGEPMPYATLMYVWANESEPESVLIHPRTDRIRKIVLERGVDHLKQWRYYKRDLAADFRRAFGEEPGALVAVALMTDADNLAAQAQAWYGEISLDGAGRLSVQR